MATVKYDPNTGKKLKSGQSVTFEGRTYTEGSSAIGGVSSSSSKSSSSSSGSSSSSSSSGGSSSSTQQIINFDPNTGEKLSAGQVVLDKNTGKYVQQGTSFGTYVSAPASAPMINEYNPNTGEKLKTGETVLNEQTGQYVTQGTVFTPTPTAIQNTVPTPVATPTLPTLTNPYESYYKSLEQQSINLQTQLDSMKNEQLQTIQENKRQAEEDLLSLREAQGDIITEQGETAITERNQKLEEVNKEIVRFDEAYKLKQGFVSQLQELMTQGNALITSQKSTTGLSAIRNPRVNETITNLTAQAGIIESAISAMDNNMTQAQNQLSTVVKAITDSYAEQLDYYKTLNDFYESQATDTNEKLINLTKQEQDFIDYTITTLQSKIDTVEENAKTMRELFMNPESAIQLAKAGINLLTPQNEWADKLLKSSQQDEIIETNKEMIKQDYTPVPFPTSTAGLIAVQTGGKTLYFKPPKEKATGEIKGTESERKSDSFGVINQILALPPEKGYVDTNGYLTAQGFKDIVNNAREDNISRKEFLEQYAYLLYPQGGKAYRLTEKEMDDYGIKAEE
jgi:hypothetical protein